MRYMEGLSKPCLFVFASFNLFPLLCKDEAMSSTCRDLERLVIGHDLWDSFST